MKDTSKAMTGKEVSPRSIEELSGKTPGSSKRAPQRSASQRQAEAVEGLNREADTIGIDIGDREGQRLPKPITKSFEERALSELRTALATSLELLLRMIDFLSMAIEEAAEDIGFLLKTRYPEAQKLMQVPGVGSITALSFMLSLGAPQRFRDSRDVGAFLA